MGSVRTPSSAWRDEGCLLTSCARRVPEWRKKIASHYFATFFEATVEGRSSRRQATALRSDPPIAQRLDREDHREPTGHSEDIQSPDEQQGAALLEKLLGRRLTPGLLHPF